MKQRELWTLYDLLGDFYELPEAAEVRPEIGHVRNAVAAADEAREAKK